MIHLIRNDILVSDVLFFFPFLFMIIFFFFNSLTLYCSSLKYISHKIVKFNQNCIMGFGVLSPRDNSFVDSQK